MVKCFTQYLMLALFYCTQLCGEESTYEEIEDGIKQQHVQGQALAYIGSPIPSTPILGKAATVNITLPIGWHIAEKNSMTPHVELMVVGKGKGAYPPSINLAVEKYDGTMKEYLKGVKEYNDTHRSRWKDLGKFHTVSGDASLSQLDFTSQWGNERMMHIMLLKSGYMYILTAAALKEEFSDYYKEFFAAFRSMKIEAHDAEPESSPLSDLSPLSH